MKIHIFYRHFNVSGNDLRHRPSWFDFESCFTNLLKSIQNKDIKLYVIFDKSKGEIQNNFIFKYRNKFNLIEINAGKDIISFVKTWHITKKLNIPDNELIYFLENDYLHINNWISFVSEFFQENPHSMKDNYLSLYDHNDKYFYSRYSDLHSKVLSTTNRHWRTSPSTCGSFIVNKKVFLEDFDIHTTTAGDHKKFLYLKSNRNRNVISPLPSLSTHCMKDLLAPTINWKHIINNEKKI